MNVTTDFAIFYDHKLLVILGGKLDCTYPSILLDWYAEKYAFDRNKLTHAYISTIHLTHEVNRAILDKAWADKIDELAAEHGYSE